ncbi:hypothetical protein M422DRAFT_266754 [Sphaerobolus stellatus SS14]|uniref:Uncharacterized protein n=1 Tax=Sphaerobolus stellatus (strain SS14) TaxID=990650 RepID=A0A0C9TNC9_SPHS4|nr:hypothetical protein M422DRAFT_266754 [Sphaerobolus stellatus SS14]
MIGKVKLCLSFIPHQNHRLPNPIFSKRSPFSLVVLACPPVPPPRPPCLHPRYILNHHLRYSAAHDTPEPTDQDEDTNMANIFVEEQHRRGDAWECEITEIPAGTQIVLIRSFRLDMTYRILPLVSRCFPSGNDRVFSSVSSPVFFILASVGGGFVGRSMGDEEPLRSPIDFDSQFEAFLLESLEPLSKLHSNDPDWQPPSASRKLTRAR